MAVEDVADRGGPGTNHILNAQLVYGNEVLCLSFSGSRGTVDFGKSMLLEYSR
jgi:hypothetical protein